MAGINDVLSSATGFGVKEVSDVGFYNYGDVEVAENGTITIKKDPVLMLDTLKVSNIENTAEQTEAKGGKGNAPLIIWDYGREINITLQDALLSEKTLSMMFEGDASAADKVIVINANVFPGNYTLLGKTFARSAVTGKDSLFTWYVPKAKVGSEVTLTMEAEGDPTVFDMTLRVLRDTGGVMMKLIKAAEGDTSASADYNIATEFGKPAGT